LLCLDTN